MRFRRVKQMRSLPNRERMPASKVSSMATTSPAGLVTWKTTKSWTARLHAGRVKGERSLPRKSIRTLWHGWSSSFRPAATMDSRSATPARVNRIWKDSSCRCSIRRMRSTRRSILDSTTVPSMGLSRRIEAICVRLASGTFSKSPCVAPE